MLTKTRLSLLSVSLLLLFGLSLRASAADLPLPLEAMPGRTLADVQDRAAAESTAGPVWGNAPDPKDLPVHQTFRGTVTADATMTKLAIFSDDGCDVYVDGTLVWSAKDKGQALPDLPNSLHELPGTLSPGSHSVEIDYSNVIYTVADASKGIAPDIDGCTLFQYGPIPTVRVSTNNQWQPNPAAVGQTITAPVSAQVDNPPVAPSGHSVSQKWVWTTGGVYQSPNGASGSFVACNGYAIGWSQSGPTTQFSGIFQNSGYYIIKVIATVTYHDDDANSDVGTYSGEGYIGGDASDLSSSSGATPATVKARAAAAPAAAGAPKGLPVVKILKLQYAFGTSTTFNDLPAPVNGVPKPLPVDAGTTVVFKAIPDTPGAAFPTGQPQWSGIKGTASGDTYTVAFTTLNKTDQAADYQNVTATAGASTATANVLVQGVTITTDLLADKDPSATAPTPLLKRVNVNGTEYGSGTTLSLTVTPVNGFKGKVNLDIDVNSAKPDVFGLMANAADAHVRSLNYSFYEPIYRIVSGIKSPSAFTLDFSSDNNPKSVILTLTLDATNIMDAGKYQVTVFANPNEQGNTRMGSELSLPVTVVENTAPKSDPFSGGAHDGLYKTGRSYYLTGGSVGKSKNGVQYDALQATLTLPPTSPDSTSVVLDYKSGDAYDIYSGGSASDPSNGSYSELDIGLVLGHTGNEGYSTTGNYVTPADGTNKTRQRGPDNNKYDQILPGTITFTFEAPGYDDSVYGTVPTKQAFLVIQNANISLGIGQAATNTPTRRYIFTGLPNLWIPTNDINVKYNTSIAQKGDGGVVTYNGPPNFDKSPNATKPFFYTSGSKAPYVSWDGLSVHTQGAKPGFAPITLSADEAAPGNPYVNSSILNTVP